MVNWLVVKLVFFIDQKCIIAIFHKVKNIRLTLDENISYKKIINKEIGNLSTFDNYNIVELKFISNESINFVRNNFPFERSRFSKYCRGIEFINYNYCNEL